MLLLEAGGWARAHDDIAHFVHCYGLVSKQRDLLNSLGHNWCRGVLKLDDIYRTTLGYAVLITYRNAAVFEYLATPTLHDEKNATTG